MGMEFSVLRIRDTKLCMLECWYLSDAMKEKNTLEIKIQINHYVVCLRKLALIGN